MIKPYKDQPGSRKEQVRTMFNRIAGQYDFLNHFLSFNIDKIWRKKLVSMVRNDVHSQHRKNDEIRILDVATGTGDLAFALAEIKSASVTGLDIAEDMLAIAREKAGKKSQEVEFLTGDSEDLPFGDHSFNYVTVAFGVRNFENLKRGLSEMNRVLCPGGKVYILEFSTPPSPLFRFVYNFYSGRILPVMASLFTSDKAAYQYLPSSIAAFPHGGEMLNILTEAGFEDSQLRRFSGGISTLYTGVKR